MTLGYDPVPSNVISYSLGVTVSFVLNRHFTFRMSRYNLTVKDQFIRFYVVNLLSLAISTGFVYLFSRSMSPSVAKILSVPFVVIWGFLAAHMFVFTASPPQDEQ